MSTSAPAAPLGQVGPYQIERLLGTGGMGAVYLGRHRTTGVLAAVKLLRLEHAADPSFRARLRREVAAAQQVPRFCTAAVLDAGVDADPPWIATEFIDAPTLDVALVGAPPLAGAELETFATSVATALRAIHAHGVIHRDLKPSNVLMSAQGPRVIDFGIARPADPDALLTRLTQTGYAIGTPAYMAPEQLSGSELTPAVDIYAWGCLVVYAATGRPPAPADAVAEGRPPPALGNLPEPLHALVAAALDPDPARRPTAAQLLDQLTQHAPATAPATAPAPLPPAPLLSPQLPPVLPPAPVPLSVPVPPVPVPPVPVPPAAPLVRPRQSGGSALVVALTAGLTLATVVVLTVATVAAVRLWPGSEGQGPLTAGGSETGPPADAGPERPPFGLELVGPLTGHTDGVHAVAVGQLDGVPIVVSGGSDETVRVWDLTTGEQRLMLAGGHTSGIRAVAFGELDGAPIAVSAGYDRVVMVWDLESETAIHELAGHEAAIWGVAVGEVDGTPVAVSGSIDQTIRVWDLATGQQRGEPWTGHTSGVYAVALGELDGAPIVVSGSYDQSVRVWDLATGEPIGSPMRGHTEAVWGVAFGEFDGAPIVVSGSYDGSVRVWDPAAGRPIGAPLRGHTEAVYAVAVGEVDGVPVAISGSFDMTVQVWDLAAGLPVDRPLTRHAGDVGAVAFTELDGVPVAVTGSSDRTIRVWALTSAGR